MNVIMFFPRLLFVLKRGLLFTKGRGLTTTDHSPSAGGDSNGHLFTNWPSPQLFMGWVKVPFRLTVYRPAIFGVKPLLWHKTRQFRFCRCGAPSLMSWRVCHSQYMSTIFTHLFLLTLIYIFSSYPAGNTLLLRDRDQPVSAVYGDNRRLLWEPYETHKHTLWTECRVLMC
jgi:hypothetical protein